MQNLPRQMAQHGNSIISRQINLVDWFIYQEVFVISEIKLPCATPSSTNMTGDFDEDCLSSEQALVCEACKGEFRSRPFCWATQGRRSPWCGCLFVWVLYARTKQNKVPRLKVKKKGSKFTILPSPIKGEGIKLYNRKGCPRRIYQLSQYLACPWNIPTKVGYLHVKAGYSCVKATRFRVKHGMTAKNGFPPAREWRSWIYFR